MDNAQYYQKIVAKLTWATQQLGKDIEPTELENIGNLVWQTLEGKWRYFHTSEHILEVAEDNSPIAVLAAIFHDIVYVQVDECIPFNLTRYISPFIIQTSDSSYQIKSANQLSIDSVFSLISKVFGYDVGETLDPNSGQNEFLSAVVAGSILKHWLPKEIIWQISACIEATIPFRPDFDQKNPIERLYERLIATNQEFAFGYTEAKLVNIVQLCVNLANRDLQGFNSQKSEVFLDNTWDLLLESNHHLCDRDSHTIAEYRIALGKNYYFLQNFLQPSLIFNQFQGQPEKAVYERWIIQAKNNLNLARLYLGSQLVATLIVESICGNFAPQMTLSTIVGQSCFNQPLNLIDLLPPITRIHPCNNSLELEVLRILETYRPNNKFDNTLSALTNYLVKSFGFKAILRPLSSNSLNLLTEFNRKAFLAKYQYLGVKQVSLAVNRLIDQRRINKRKSYDLKL